ncbi:MAG: hypothetical protein QOH93_1551, partial [Chloroflexia bacterium]|nr:hypothetical protein [Chloroflexia bacterium]
MLLMLSGVLQLWMLLALVPLIAVLFQFHYAAFDASYAMLVPEKHLPRANGMMQTMWALSAVLSPGIAAIIVTLPELARQGLLPGFIASTLAGIHDGSALAVGVDTVTFLVAGAVLTFLHVPSPRRTDMGEAGQKPQKSMWADIKEGARYIKLRKPLIWLLVTFTVANFATAPVEVFAPILVKFNLAADWQAQGYTFESALALLYTVSGLGGVAGGIIMGAWGGLKGRKIYGVLVPVALAGLAQITFGLSPLLYLAALANFFLMVVFPISGAHSQTIWQLQVPKELQGRVFSVRRLIAQFSAPLGVMLAGATGAAFNPGLVLALLGGVIVVFSLFQLFNPHLLRVEDKAYLDSMAEEGSPEAGAVHSGASTADLNPAA